MKRATLTAYPTSLPSQPADLTDRLLQQEDAKSAKQPEKRRRGQTVRGPSRTKRSTQAVAPLTEAPPEPESGTAQPETLAVALAAVKSAAEALQTASHEAPARYDVALRYRLDALAHHLQQVKEFVESLATR